MPATATQASRIRAQAVGDKATVRVLMSHEMESGQRKDAAGKPSLAAIVAGAYAAIRYEAWRIERGE